MGQRNEFSSDTKLLTHFEDERIVLQQMPQKHQMQQAMLNPT